MFVILCHCIIDTKITSTSTILIIMLYIAHGTDLLFCVTLLLKDKAKNIRCCSSIINETFSVIMFSYRQYTCRTHIPTMKHLFETIKET